MTIQEKIKAIRLSKSISKTQMGKLLFMTYQNYSKIEDGRCRLTVDTLLDICKIFDISPFELIEIDNKNSYIMLTPEEIKTLKQAEVILKKITDFNLSPREIKIENNQNSQIIIGNYNKTNKD